MAATASAATEDDSHLKMYPMKLVAFWPSLLTNPKCSDLTTPWMQVEMSLCCLCNRMIFLSGLMSLRSVLSTWSTIVRLWSSTSTGCGATTTVSFPLEVDSLSLDCEFFSLSSSVSVVAFTVRLPMVDIDLCRWG
jgi:hypothetical protein